MTVIKTKQNKTTKTRAKAWLRDSKEQRQVLLLSTGNKVHRPDSYYLDYGIKHTKQKFSPAENLREK